jgi:hypothetical protein
LIKLRFFFLIIYLFLKNIARYCLDNGAHVDSLNRDGNTPLFCAAERFSSACGKVRGGVEKKRDFHMFII